MKKYEAPTLEVAMFATEDIVTTSGGGFIPPVQGGDDTPYG